MGGSSSDPPGSVLAALSLLGTRRRVRGASAGPVLLLHFAEKSPFLLWGNRPPGAHPHLHTGHQIGGVILAQRLQGGGRNPLAHQAPKHWTVPRTRVWVGPLQPRARRGRDAQAWGEGTGDSGCADRQRWAVCARGCPAPQTHAFVFCPRTPRDWASHTAGASNLQPRMAWAGPNPESENMRSFCDLFSPSLVYFTCGPAKPAGWTPPPQSLPWGQSLVRARPQAGAAWCPPTRAGNLLALMGCLGAGGRPEPGPSKSDEN